MKNKSASPPSICWKPLNIATLEMESYALIPSTDNMVAWGICVRPCLECVCNALATCARRQCVLEWRCGHLDRHPNLLCNRLGDQTPEMSPGTMPRTPPDFSCNAVIRPIRSTCNLSWNFASCQMLSHLTEEFCVLVLSSRGFTCSTVIPDGPLAAPRRPHFKIFENKLWYNVKTLSDRLNSSGKGSLETRARRRNWSICLDSHDKGGSINFVWVCMKASPSHEHGLCPAFGFQQAFMWNIEGLLRVESGSVKCAGFWVQGFELRVKGSGEHRTIAAPDHPAPYCPAPDPPVLDFQIFALFFPLPTLSGELFFEFPRSFVELRWSLRVIILKNVFEKHIWALWTSCETPAAFGGRRGSLNDPTPLPARVVAGVKWTATPADARGGEANSAEEGAPGRKREEPMKVGQRNTCKGHPPTDRLAI